MILTRKELEQYPIVGEGYQGQVYKIDNETVIKLCDSSNLELLKEMSKLDLKQFLKPKEEVVEFNNCYAFAYPFLDKTDNKSILLLLKQTLLENINNLLEDIKILSDKRILIFDVIPRNCFCIHNIIYMIDFDLYSFASSDLSEEQVLNLNIEKLEYFFQKIWIKALVELGFDNHPEYFCKSYITTIKEQMKEEENIKEYIKRRLNNGI